MRQLTKLQSSLFLVGGLLMVLGAGCYVFLFQQRIACWVFLLGSLLFASMQLMQTYEGTDIVLRRLRNILSLADLFFMLAGVLMVENSFHFAQPLFKAHYIAYVTYVLNKWVVVLLIAALLEMYAMHRISSELSQKNTKTKG